VGLVLQRNARGTDSNPHVNLSRSPCDYWLFDKQPGRREVKDFDELKDRFLQQAQGQSEEQWNVVLSQVNALADAVSQAAVDGLLQELSELNKKAVARDTAADTALFDLPSILAWRISTHFRKAAEAVEQSRKPKSMEAGADEEMDEYRAISGD